MNQAVLDLAQNLVGQILGLVGDCTDQKLIQAISELEKLGEDWMVWWQT